MLDFDRFEVVTFDCYGTLIDWESGILAAIRPILAAHGADPGNEEILSLYATLESRAETGPFRGYREILGEVVDGFGHRWRFTPSREERSALADSVGSWRPFADTVEALGILKRSYRLAVVSNVDDDLFAGSARLLRTDFDRVVTAQQVRAYKPSPRMFEAAIERIAYPRETILHVAQSLYHDIVPAKGLGLSTVWVNRRGEKVGSGATPEAHAEPDLEVPDLRTLVSRIGLA